MPAVLTCVLVLLALAPAAAASAASLGRPTVVFAADADEHRPRLAYHAGRDEYLAVWHQEVAAPPPGSAARVVLGRRLDRHGLPLGVAFVIGPVDGRDRMLPDVAYEPGSDRYLVVYLYDYGDGLEGADWDVRGRFVPGTGPDPALEELVIAQSAEPERDPRVAWGADGSYLAVWWVDASPAFVQGAVGRFGQRPGSPAALAFAPGRELRSPAVAYDAAGDRFLVAFSDGADVVGTLVAPDLTAGLELPLATDPELEGAPALAGCGAGFLLAWERAGGGGDVAVRLLAADGGALDDGGPFTVAPSSGIERSPAVACHGHLGLVAFEAEGAAGLVGIAGALVDAAAPAVGAAFDLRPVAAGEAGDVAGFPAVGAAAAGWAVAWEADRQPDATWQDLHARALWRLFADGFEWGDTGEWSAVGP